MKKIIEEIKAKLIKIENININIKEFLITVKEVTETDVLMDNIYRLSSFSNIIKQICYVIMTKIPDTDENKLKIYEFMTKKCLGKFIFLSFL
jgi:nitrate reductase NapAB chaperone NapD